MPQAGQLKGIIIVLSLFFSEVFFDLPSTDFVQLTVVLTVTATNIVCRSVLDIFINARLSYVLLTSYV